MKKIDIEKWKNFIIADLFDKCELKFKKENFNKASDISLEQTEEFSLPLVNAKHSNNGIMYYGRPKDFESEEMTIDIVADGAASTGDVYAQPQKTGVLYNAYLIKPKFKASKNILLYLATVIQLSIKKKFGYENKCTWEKVKLLKILLPANSENHPDWEYMENYMKNIMANCESNLDNLKLCV